MSDQQANMNHYQSNEQMGAQGNQMEEANDQQQFSQDFQSDDDQNPRQTVNKQLKQGEMVPKVANPISPYGVFTKQYREKHAGEKISMSTFGEIWNSLGPEEKNVYEQKFKQQKQKYQEYEAYMLSIDPTFGKKTKTTSNLLFPLHRVKAIMKQDNAFTTSAENVTAMTRAVEYFGEFLLQQVKKASEGGKRIDLESLFQAVNNSQSNLWFLNCLIDEHNITQSHSAKPAAVQQRKTHQASEITAGQINNKNEEQVNPAKLQKTAQAHSKKKNVLPKGQLKLTDMF